MVVNSPSNERLFSTAYQIAILENISTKVKGFNKSAGFLLHLLDFRVSKPYLSQIQNSCPLVRQSACAKRCHSARSSSKTIEYQLKLLCMQNFKRLFFAFLFFAFSPAFLVAQTMFAEPLSDRIANYTIAVTLDDSARVLDGRITLRWKNASTDTVPDLRFHLYFNAFKNNQSTFALESKGDMPWKVGDAWGWTEITALSVRGQDHTGRMQHIAPDDGNADDQTVVQVLLSNPALPGETLEIDYDFHAKIPRNHTRTGWWGDDFFFMVQWFPKIGVYEKPGMRLVPADAERGRWNCHQFHPSTEFYADFGVYDVQITVPTHYKVASSGIIHRERLNSDHTKTVFAYAEDVHDFAWLADASVQEFEDSYQNPRSGQIVNIRLMLQPGHELAEQAYFESAKATLRYFDDWLGDGAYPYPQLTIVDPQPGSGAGGMEYPTLITGGVFYPLSWWTNNKLRIVEIVTIHELAHQFWQGMVASNEFEEAFLDEGFTTYSENRIGEALYGSKTSLLDFGGLKISGEFARRPAYVHSHGKSDATLEQFTFEVDESRNLAYNKWSLALKTLERMIGRQKFDAILRNYFQRWRFKHPAKYDFIAVANEVNGESLDWFFDQIIFGDGVVDFAVASVQNRLQEELADNQYNSEVTVRRIGDVMLPVEVLVGFSDGSEVLEKWDGKARTHKFHYSRPARITRVVVDPELKIPLDVNLMNNSQMPANQHVMQKYLLKWLFWMQSTLALLSVLS